MDDRNNENGAFSAKLVIVSENPVPPYLEAVIQSCSLKKVFLEISQNSQKITCARFYFLIK